MYNSASEAVGNSDEAEALQREIVELCGRPTKYNWLSLYSCGVAAGDCPKERSTRHNVKRRSYSSNLPKLSEISSERETKVHDPTVPSQMIHPPNAEHSSCVDNKCSLPQCVVIKMLRSLANKKRDFMKLRKTVITQQNHLLEQYAALREMETKVGSPVDETLGEVRILSVTKWPAHDLLLLVREDLRMPMDTEIGGIFGPQVLQQIHNQLIKIPEEVLSVGAEVMARRIDLLHLLRGKNQRDRLSYNSNLESKTKNAGLDRESDRLQKLVASTVETIKSKISYSLELAKIPWMDRDNLIKKSERLQKENTALVHKLEELIKKDQSGDQKDLGAESNKNVSSCSSRMTLEDDLKKERAAREALKEVVAAAESMLRVARGRITTLEKQQKDSKAELETARKKIKDLEQLHRNRESSYDARSRKLLESSKTGEMAIETLSRQRDVLEIRVKELREQIEAVENEAERRENELIAQMESLHAKLLDQERKREAAETRATESENRLMVLEKKLETLREHTNKLNEAERMRRYMDCVPTKENEPSDREMEIWKELQSTRMALSRTEEQLRLARADKDSFLESLSKMAAEGPENIHNKMATMMVEREQEVNNLKKTIESLKENEKLMEQSVTDYKNQMASLRYEIMRLRNYDCYAKEIPYQELQTQLLDLHMKVDLLQQEREALTDAVASRALMLERHERAADLFTRIIRARRDISAILEARADPPPIDDEFMPTEAEASTLTSLCVTAADTWSALRTERERSLRLERAVLLQNLQLEREGRVRVQVERRRALLQRDLVRTRALLTCADQPVPSVYHSVTSAHNMVQDPDKI